MVKVQVILMFYLLWRGLAAYLLFSWYVEGFDAAFVQAAILAGMLLGFQIAVCGGGKR